MEKYNFVPASLRGRVIFGKGNRMKFPTYEEMGQEVANRVLDEYEYKGKTLREWVEIISAIPVTAIPATDTNVCTKLGTNLAEVGTDCISRQAAIDAVRMVIGDNRSISVCDAIKRLPPASCLEIPNSSDTISRQDAVSRRRLLSDLKELITAWEKYPVMAEQIKGVEVAIGYVELIPSAQPDIIRCRNCKFASGDSRICMKFDHSPIGELDFCSFAERREVTT